MRLESRADPPLEMGDVLPVETMTMFANVIEDHLALKQRNAELEPAMPIDRYRTGDPFENHPLFKSEEQALIEDTMDGTVSFASEEHAFAAAEPDVVAHAVSDDGLWGRSRDFDWGD